MVDFFFLNFNLQVCQLQGNGIGISTARAQAERATDAEAVDQGLYDSFTKLI